MCPKIVKEKTNMIDLEEFNSRFCYFKKMDSRTNPYSFGEFWRWKLRTETKNVHILDAEHVGETYDKLSQILRIWQWHRPYPFLWLANGLKHALDEIDEAYNKIRNYSFLEFGDIPNEPLEQIWNSLGSVKNGGKRNRGGYYLVMGATKPFMFLWGQTLAFDSIVRKFIPRFDINGLSGNCWSFGTWKKIMVRFQESLKQQPEVADFFKEISLKHYGAGSIIPYGQFLDLYYWVGRR